MQKKRLDSTPAAFPQVEMISNRLAVALQSMSAKLGMQQIPRDSQTENSQVAHSTGWFCNPRTTRSLLLQLGPFRLLQPDRLAEVVIAISELRTRQIVDMGSRLRGSV